jgi:hypothetical protein
VIWLRLRRFFCDAGDCPKMTFARAIPGSRPPRTPTHIVGRTSTACPGPCPRTTSPPGGEAASVLAAPGGGPAARHGPRRPDRAAGRSAADSRRRVAHRRPALAPVLDRLRDEHAAIAVLLEHLRRVVVDADLDRATLLSEVDRLTAEVVRHVDYEEEQLVPVLGGATGAASHSSVSARTVGCFVGSATMTSYQETRSTRRGVGHDRRSSLPRFWLLRLRRLPMTCGMRRSRRGSTVVFRRPMSPRGPGTRWSFFSRSTPSVLTADRSCSGSVCNVLSATGRRSETWARIRHGPSITTEKYRQTSDARTKAPILFRQVGALFGLFRRSAPGGIHPNTAP